MGKKYVVEIGRLERLYKASISAKGMPNMTWLSPEVDLTPYTEPDLEQVRADAYLAGLKDGQGVTIESQQNNAFNDGYKKCLKDMEQVSKEGYEKGLSDAEEGKATCQYCEYQYLDDTEEPCKKCCCAYVNKYKPKAKEEKIQVGDEVRSIERGWTAIVTRLKEGYLTLMDNSGEIANGYVKNMFTKTGRHFPEIAEALRKLKESE